eukprot:SAG11_NODE_495_length_8943_cov_274.008028_11_plen_202_part_01
MKSHLEGPRAVLVRPLHVDAALPAAAAAAKNMTREDDGARRGATRQVDKIRGSETMRPRSDLELHTRRSIRTSKAGHGELCCSIAQVQRRAVSSQGALAAALDLSRRGGCASMRIERAKCTRTRAHLVLLLAGEQDSIAFLQRAERKRPPDERHVENGSHADGGGGGGGGGGGSAGRGGRGRLRAGGGGALGGCAPRGGAGN